MPDLPAARPDDPRLWSLAQRPYQPKSLRAIWLQIYDRLAQAIDEGIVAPGSRLPGEVQLSEMFRVSRVTMRRALALHQSEGTLQARKGVGIFVRQTPRTFVIQNDMRFADSLVGCGQKLTSRTLRLDRAAPSSEAAQLFGLGGGDEVIVLHRMRLLDGMPIYFTRKELPAHRFLDFERIYSESQSVSAVYKAAGIPWFRRAETRVRGGLAQPAEAEILGINVKTPVQYVIAVNRTLDGEAIEYNLGCWPMTSVEFIFNLPNQPQP
ncbi:HTH-type transcriptional repressor YvoA [Thalassovita gelatinovora]|uniref:HTH-type transcriptional repressor YvoA n=1 Tax=Thalassovita gelatinovora TaxID=53501 RepID=A0A0P1FB83_THAGE|nr:GntR family transcriptional regulator [Thalassovita gelatinovora]QIZ80056.1 GntR family transcriptional regulator [Thalassovita gelatinovora]CUH65459.1 HTH-type transcriptional repressor YvoA [Thalassovita gelatinovora]SER09329.1 transcriptional regulator, GntR family [Thalassovita gelatinovora]